MKILNTLPSPEDFVSNGQNKLSDPKTEERIIAALVANPSVAWPQVKDVLSPSDFSSEQWRVIYKSVQYLANANTTIDTVTIEHSLRRIGKYDAAGGDATVSTIGLRFDEDITAYRDIVLNLSLKRQAIARWKDYIAKAESERTNISTLIADASKDMADFAENATPLTSEAKMASLSELLLVKTRPDPSFPLVTIDQTPVVKRGDHSLVVGKKKSRKSLLLSHLIAEYIRNHGTAAAAKVLVFDTEQDREDVWLARERVRKTTGCEITFANMRGMHPNARRDFISWQIRQQPVEFVIIDGIRDCMSNILDIDETTNVVVWLEDMTVRQRLAVVNVLHLNKTDNNVRGHIGTELTNKALCTIEVVYDKKTGLSNCICESARRMPFNDFSFTHGQDGNIHIIGQTLAAGESVTGEERDKRLDAIFEGQMLEYTVLRKRVQEDFAVGQKKAEVMIAGYLRSGVLIKSGKRGDPTTKYKLVGSMTNSLPEDLPETIREPESTEGEQTDLPF